ncbi:MAG: hypothetical protein AAF990_27190 [Bacteroidota bacterium]
MNYFTPQLDLLKYSCTEQNVYDYRLTANVPVDAIGYEIGGTQHSMSTVNGQQLIEVGLIVSPTESSTPDEQDTTLHFTVDFFQLDDSLGPYTFQVKVYLESDSGEQTEKGGHHISTTNANEVTRPLESQV